MSETSFSFCVSIPKPCTKRIDLYLQQVFSTHSRHTFQKALENGDVLLNGKTSVKHAKVRYGDEIKVTFRVTPSTIFPESDAIDIIFENGDFAVINKDAGVITHPVPGVNGKTGTLVNRLLYHLSSLGGINGVVRPGIVHRLDKDTSGLMLVAKTNEAMTCLQKIIQNRKITKKYIALVHGKVAHENGFIESYIGRSPTDRKKMTTLRPIAPRLAQTRFRVLAHVANYSLVEVELLTGRTHQIRVHFASIKHPVVCDATYGFEAADKEFTRQYGLTRQFLHAWKLSFDYGKTPYHFIGELKTDLVTTLKKLELWPIAE